MQAYRLNHYPFYEISKNNVSNEHLQGTASLEFQKQPPEVFCKKRCSSKSRKIHKKTPVQEPQTLWHSCFLMNLAKFLRTPIFIKHLISLNKENSEKVTYIESTFSTASVMLLLLSYVDSFFRCNIKEFPQITYNLCLSRSYSQESCKCLFSLRRF